MSMKKYHIFWILIDSARNYESDEDDRGLPSSVAKFSKESIFFKNTVTSAPSTIQSISSMMTSVPSFYLSRSYNNYVGISDYFDYFPHVLKNNGYNLYGAIYFKHGREIMTDLFGTLNKRLYPKGLSHRKEVWNNLDIYNVFKKIMDSNDWNVPTMSYLHYNVRVDTNISDIISQTINSIDKKGLMDDSIIIINSDHGYPSKIRKWDANDAKRRGWGHDELMYNDSLLTPLIIKYPNCQSKIIENFVATVDIVPSISHILNLPISKKYTGINLFDPKLDLDNRLIRSDNRYISQLPSKTSFIYNNKKCIINNNKTGESTYEYYNLTNDKSEKNNLDFNDDFKSLQIKIDENIEEYNSFHEKLLLEKWKSIQNKSINSILIIVDSSPAFNDIIRSICSKLYPDAKISILKDNYDENKFDLVLFIIDSELPWSCNKKLKFLKKIKYKKIIYLDDNGNIYYHLIKFNLYFNFIKKRLVFLKTDKLYLFDLLKRLFLKKILKPIK